MTRWAAFRAPRREEGRQRLLDEFSGALPVAGRVPVEQHLGIVMLPVREP
jgi:hypothetical protein